MYEATRIDHETHSGDDPSPVSPPPIIIVQKGRSNWARELLLIVLLLSTAAYIFYQEYRGPSIIVRAETNRPGKAIDAVPVAAVSEGGIVVRANEEHSPPTDPIESQSVDREVDPAAAVSRADSLKHEPLGALVSAVQRAIVDATGNMASLAPPEDPPRPDDLLASEVIDGPGPSPFDQDVLPGGDIEEEEPPKRSKSVIVWDHERKEAPPIRAEEPVAPPAPRELEDRPRADRTLVRDLDRRPIPQSLAQRRHFLQSLSLAIRQYGRQAGPHIDGLCRELRIPLPPEVVQLEQHYGANLFHRGAELDQTVTTLRQLGAPEHYLLERLSDQMIRTIGARHGPRDPMEARVFAARKLLAIPLTEIRNDPHPAHVFAD